MNKWSSAALCSKVCDFSRPSRNMRSQALRADFLMLITAMIWGTAFVAQRIGMDNIGPFLFTGLRFALGALARSEEHTSELQSLMRISYAVFCLKKKNQNIR